VFNLSFSLYYGSPPDFAKIIKLCKLYNLAWATSMYSSEKSPISQGQMFCIIIMYSTYVTLLFAIRS